MSVFIQSAALVQLVRCGTLVQQTLGENGATVGVDVSVQKCTKVYRNVQESTGVYKSVQECTGGQRPSTQRPCYSVLLLQCPIAVDAPLYNLYKSILAAYAAAPFVLSCYQIASVVCILAPICSVLLLYASQPAQ